MFGLTLEQWLDAAQSIALVVGGFWALYLYASTRKNHKRARPRADLAARYADAQRFTPA